MAQRSFDPTALPAAPSTISAVRPLPGPITTRRAVARPESGHTGPQIATTAMPVQVTALREVALLQPSMALQDAAG